jgi:hypothetical protein
MSGMMMMLFLIFLLFTFKAGSSDDSLSSSNLFCKQSGSSFSTVLSSSLSFSDCFHFLSLFLEEDDDDGDADSSPLLNETKDDVPFDDEMDQEDLTSSNNVEKVDNPNEIGGFTVLGEVKGKAHKQVEFKIVFVFSFFVCKSVSFKFL